MVQSEFCTKIKPVKWVGSGDVSDVINGVPDATTGAWFMTTGAADETTGTPDVLTGVANEATGTANGTTGAPDAINGTANEANQAWVMTNEAWDEANQASVIAGKPRKVAKNATFTGFDAWTGQNEAVLVRDGRAVEGHRSPRRWRVDR